MLWMVYGGDCFIWCTANAGNPPKAHHDARVGADAAGYGFPSPAAGDDPTIRAIRAAVYAQRTAANDSRSRRQP